MTRLDVLSAIGASAIHVVSENTTVIEWKKGGARPATAVEIKLLGLLLGTV
jgi:hypothetical protein